MQRETRDKGGDGQVPGFLHRKVRKEEKYEGGDNIERQKWGPKSVYSPEILPSSKESKSKRIERVKSSHVH
ncbi:hypothetical protein ETH_00031355 [Eimeria tenella]|uniref:Uncharacterized protein n=1 Tax=Eimeria tenella TaxID=5802 RepID=U6L303_EIMTE|nr:hypothetical protein ETH_00031355 [Eimeria tenella]CDJ42974.1 hypothetical protein ETH_00031355 [Eimeria tenella]|eukprot:XP_013233724.1 hypothetical protein ETH_00031355 [Eimeria tenella]